MLPKIYISSQGEFVDENGNLVQLRGVNFDPTVKFPSNPNYPTYLPINFNQQDQESVSFINHPIPIAEVKPHIFRLKSLGFNCLRVPFTWESMEHDGPGKYDFEYIDYLITLLKTIHMVDNGMYIYLDPHQDVWSRFTGGSGAPLWTLYAAGFQPNRFYDTSAVLLHSGYASECNDTKKILPMLWTTNYYRLACQTMFTLFFGGKTFAPKCVINGVNIQDYLQDKFIDTIITFYSRCLETAPCLFTDNCIIGLESMNEPNSGYIGMENLGKLSSDRHLKLGTTPTALQSFLLGEGIDCTVEYYKLKLLGPMKQGTKQIKTNKSKCWLTEEERNEVDIKYKWKRGEEWLPHQCVWKLHDVWSSNGHLLKPNYFHINPIDNSIIDERTFINQFFMNYYAKLYKKFRSIDNDRFIFIQPPVLKEPPNILSSKYSELIDDKTVYACHYYDGYSLMFKTWNKYFNVNTYAIMRGKPACFNILIGEQNIRNSFKNQLKLMRQEVATNIGYNVPVIFSEIGMPFDMDNKKSYFIQDPTNCYNSQTKAMDAIMYALESNNLSFNLWCYCHVNTHEYGDHWNQEDFSIWCKDDMSLNRNMVSKVQYPMTLKSDIIKLDDSTNEWIEKLGYCCHSAESINLDGIRPLSSLLRPFPLRINGNFVAAKFNCESKEYSLNLKCNDRQKKDQGCAFFATYIFLPQYHFPVANISIETSSGSLIYYAKYQVLKWNHEIMGDQYIKIKSQK